MIVPMKKIVILALAKDAAATLKRLGNLGLLHIEHEKLPKGKDIQTLKDDIELVTKATNILLSAMREDKTALSEESESTNWKDCAEHVVNSYNRIDQLEEYMRNTKDAISKWEKWRDFNPDNIRSLREKNIYIKLYEIPAKEFKKLPSNLVIKKISAARGVVSFALISRGENELPFKELALPKIGLTKMRERISEDLSIIKSIREDLEKHTIYIKSFNSIKKFLEKELEFQEARHGAGQTGEIVYITGYAPYDVSNIVLACAKVENWGITIKDPSETDNVPTLIQNPKWISIINPIFKLLEIVPGYREFDISLWFLLFFSVFFGMLIGDAGYGIIFALITGVFHKKFGKKIKSKSVFTLFYILSFCAVIWGSLTGTFFGQAWLPATVKPLLPLLRNDKNIQELCFILGACQLSVAHLWRSIIKLPSVKALSDIGWISVLWGAFFLAKTLILGDIFPDFAKWFFITGVVLVIFFTNPGKNIIKGIGSGLGNLLLNIVNSFTDIVSYIRLFAVGLATVAIADAFNAMAMNVGFGTVLTGALTAVILLLGHSLNIILGPLAILVHGVRLNVLEFSSHLNMGWSGISYKPLKK